MVKVSLESKHWSIEPDQSQSQIRRPVMFHSPVEASEETQRRGDNSLQDQHNTQTSQGNFKDQKGR